MIESIKTIKKKIYILFILASVPCFSQIQLEGKVKSDTESIPYANVILTELDGTFKTGSITLEDGTFEINTSKGTYILSISFVGYETYEEEIQLTDNLKLDDIVLTTKETSLDEVTVTARKKLIRKKVDRLVYNIEDNIAASGGDAVDALRISPGVTVNGNAIAMIGKSNMAVMLDGRIIELSGEDLVSFLSSIPTDDIKEIEIITNPPARYEAEGNSGLINIIYKKGIKNSWNNRTSLTYFQAIFPKYTLRNNFTYQKDKINLIFGVNATTGNTNIDRESEILNPTGLWTISRTDKWNNENLSGRFMVDYKIKDNSTIGFQYLGTISNPNPSQTTNSSTTIFNETNTVDSLFSSGGRSRDDRGNHSLNTHYITKLDTLGKSLSIDLDYFLFTSDNERNVDAQSFTADNSFLNTIFSNQNISDQEVNNYSAKVDIEHPTKFINLSYGAKASFTNSKYKTDNFNTITGTPIFVANNSDDFEYIENNQSLYVSGSKKIKEKWNAQFGLRVENTQTEGISNVLNQTNVNDYTQFFPSFYLSYDANDNNNYSLTYGRRINRPLYYQLNPARTFISNTNFMEGNPLLTPSFINNFEFSHVFKRKLVTRVFFSLETDGFGEISDIDPETNEQFFTHQNFFDQYSYGISQFYTFNKVSWWTSQNSVYLIGSTSKFSIQNDISAEEQNGTRFYAATNNTFTLNKSKTLKGQLNYWYSSAYRKNLFEYSDSYSLNLALQLELFKKDMRVSLQANDILNTSPRKTTSITNNIEQTQITFPSNRNFRLTLSYSFGNKKVRVRERGFGNEEEKGRVGN